MPGGRGGLKSTGLTILETLAPLQQPERYWVGHLQHQNLVFPKWLPRNSASGLDDGGLRRFQGVGPVLLSTKCLMLLAGWKPWPCVAAPAGIRRGRRRRIDLARQYAPNLSDDDSLTRLQHLGGKTNLIDFTRDLNVALFFGSHHSPDRNGRVILMEEPTSLATTEESSLCTGSCPAGILPP